MQVDLSNPFTNYALIVENPPVNVNQIHKRLPRYVTSEDGMIGDSHLIYFLDKEKPPNRNDIILNSFTKRKFQSGNHDDEQSVPKTAKSLKECNCYQQPLLTDNGYAISSSGWHDVFIPDDKIKEVASCSQFDDTKENLIICFYPDGKCIISKPSYFSSSITSIAMLLYDNGVDYDFKTLLYGPKSVDGIYLKEYLFEELLFVHALKKKG